MAPSIAAEPEELLRAGEGIGVRTGRAGNISKRAGDAGRGLQIETGVCPAQHQFVVQLLKIKARGRDARGVFDGCRMVRAIQTIGPRIPCYECVSKTVNGDGPGQIPYVIWPRVAVGPEQHTV